MPIGPPNLPRSMPHGHTQFPQLLRSGHYHFIPSSSSLGANPSLGNGTMRLHAFPVPRSLTLSRIGCEVTAAGDANSTVRLVIYADDGSGLPGALVLDSAVSGSASTVLNNGLVSGGSATVQEVTINTALTEGLYWIGAVIQGVTTTQPTMRTVGNQVLPSSSATIPTAAATWAGYSYSGVTGAPPASLGSPTASGSTYRIFIKVA